MDYDKNDKNIQICHGQGEGESLCLMIKSEKKVSGYIKMSDCSGGTWDRSYSSESYYICVC